MAFRLGNFNIDEVLLATYECDDKIQYTLDQLSSAQIEISAESTDITDKNGNVVRTIYTSKTGTFTATNAFLHAQIMATQGGTDAKFASADTTIKMPKFVVVDAGESVVIDDAIVESVQAIGMYGNGASDEAIADPTSPTYYNTSTKKWTAPTAEEGKEKCMPVSYLLSYDRNAESGAVIVNDAKTFPKKGSLTLQCSYIDPCSDDTAVLYVVIPSFQPDPNMTISLDRETQELDFNGNILVDYCSGSTKALYYIYLPDENPACVSI